MQQTKRNKEIIKLSKTTPVKLLAKKYKISNERIRQIISGYDYLNKDYYKKIKTEYEKNLKKILNHNFTFELERLSVHNRTKEFTIQRYILIKYLHDKLKYSFSEIGRLLKRDHTTIIHIYKNGRN